MKMRGWDGREGGQGRKDGDIFCDLTSGHGVLTVLVFQTSCYIQFCVNGTELYQDVVMKNQHMLGTVVELTTAIQK